MKINFQEYIDAGGFYKTVVEDGADIILIADYAGKIVYHNPSVEDTLGYPPRSLNGQSFFDLIHPEKVKEVKRDFKKATKNHYTENIEFLFKKSDGEYMYLEFNAINLKNKDNLEALILDCRDIEQRKKAAEEILRAQKAKELFLANMSHEIRTPINGIAGMVNLLKEFDITNEQRKYLEAISNSADHLKIIINDILDFAAIESGKLKFEQIGFNLKEQIENVIKTFSFAAKEKGLSLEYTIDDQIPAILIGDTVRLGQVLVNLINNALKFTEKGSINVSAELHGQNKMAQVYISVKDSGIGIPKEKLDKIFESFSQADTSITRKYGGTGLGLAICKQLVELQNGTMAVESAFGVGSNFHFTISYKIGTDDDLPESEVQVLDSRLHSLMDYSILLVEDNEINRMYASKLLEKWDCNLELAENGKVAIEQIEKSQFDLVLMDLQMPIMDGYEATKLIRSWENDKSKIPIVALTANAIKGDNEKCLEVGMNDYLSKPFTPDQLYTKIAKILNPALLSAGIDKGPSVQKDGLVNLDHLNEICDGDTKFIKEMIETFNNKTSQHLTEMKNNVENQEWVSVGRIAHQIKPSMTLLGISSLEQPVRDIEQYGKEETQLDQLPELVNSFCATCEQAILELEDILEKDF